MGTLSDRLSEIRAEMTPLIPEEAKAIMHKFTEDLRHSGILSTLPAVGSPLLAFELPDTSGNTVRSDDLLARGPLVVTFYRGLW